MERAVGAVEFGSPTIGVLVPEQLLVLKAISDRCEDWLDIEQVLIGVRDIEEAEAFGWLERFVGPRDKRLHRLQQLWDRTRECR